MMVFSGAYYLLKVREGAMVMRHACGLLGGGGEHFFEVSLRGGKHFFHVSLRGGEAFFSWLQRGGGEIFSKHY